MAMSEKQRRRQGKDYRDAGRYAKVNPCYLCGKSAGVEYCSHPLTDCEGTDGESFGDIALCLCEKCYYATQRMTTITDVQAYGECQRAKTNR